IARKDVASMEPMKMSLMPAGLTEQLSADDMEDLLTFLFVNPLEPAPITRTDPPMPKARTREELAAVLGDSVGSGGPKKELRVLLCAGPKDHGVDEHDYPLWLERWTKLLKLGD